MSDQREGPVAVLCCDGCRWLSDGYCKHVELRCMGADVLLPMVDDYRLSITTPAWCPCLLEGDNQQTKGTNDGN